jgi:hypothetical protein
LACLCTAIRPIGSLSRRYLTTDCIDHTDESRMIWTSFLIPAIRVIRSHHWCASVYCADCLIPLVAALPRCVLHASARSCPQRTAHRTPEPSNCLCLRSLLPACGEKIRKRGSFNRGSWERQLPATAPFETFEAQAQVRAFSRFSRIIRNLPNPRISSNL